MRSGRIVPTWCPGPRRAASRRAAAMLSPLDGPMPKPRRPNSRAVAIASGSGTSTGSVESDGVRVEEPAHALDDARYPPDDLWVALRSERRRRHRLSDDRVVAVIPQRVRHAHQRAAGADTGDEAVQAERRPVG